MDDKNKTKKPQMVAPVPRPEASVKIVSVKEKPASSPSFMKPILFSGPKIMSKMFGEGKKKK